MAPQVPSRKYRIERYLAEGGMGAIYVGKKIGPGGFEKEVVLKQLLPEFTSRPEFRDLFFREAKITATLDHQNIVRTFDLVNANERLFIVMEYVRGADLRTIAWRARRRKPLSAQAILHVGLEILAGLSYAHTRRSPTGEALGIIHRDLSPSNILCSGEGEVKLSDFGIAKAVTYSSVFYRVRGKVGYMSPEMARNQPIDARSDLFSLGVSIYETFIGERIYTGDLNTPPDKIYAQAVPPLATKCPGLPDELQAVFDRALAIDRDARYRDAEAFAQALRQVAIDHHLLYSAPDLAAELREIMGGDSEHWLSDKRDPMHGRATRPGQDASGDEASSLVEPGADINAGDDADDDNLPTPPVRTSGSPAAVSSRSSAAIASRSSSQMSSATGQSSGQVPIPTSYSSGQVPIPTSHSSGQLPMTPGRPAGQPPAAFAGFPQMMAATPPPPASPQATAPSAPTPQAAAPPTPATPLAGASSSAATPVAPTTRQPASPFIIPRVYGYVRSGGTAAFKRSRRGLWIGVLLLLAILLGFTFVRVFLRPVSEGSSGGPLGQTAGALVVGHLDASDA